MVYIYMNVHSVWQKKGGRIDCVDWKVLGPITTRNFCFVMYDNKTTINPHLRSWTIHYKSSSDNESLYLKVWCNGMDNYYYKWRSTKAFCLGSKHCKARFLKFTSMTWLLCCCHKQWSLRKLYHMSTMTSHTHSWVNGLHLPSFCSHG